MFQLRKKMTQECFFALKHGQDMWSLKKKLYLCIVKTETLHALKIVRCLVSRIEMRYESVILF